MTIRSTRTTFAAMLVAVAGVSVAQPIFNPANGHYYEVVQDPSGNIDWYTARD